MQPRSHIPQQTRPQEPRGEFLEPTLGRNGEGGIVVWKKRISEGLHGSATFTTNNKQCSQQCSKIDPTITNKCYQNGPHGAAGERSWNLPRGIGKKEFDSDLILEPLGALRASSGEAGGIHFRPWTPPGVPPMSPRSQL